MGGGSARDKKMYWRRAMLLGQFLGNFKHNYRSQTVAEECKWFIQIWYKSRYQNKPFAFFGHCLGAIIMFEIAQKLAQEHGPAPVHLFVSGAPAPHLYLASPLYALPESKFLEMLRLVNFTNTEALFKDDEMLQLALPTIRADFEVATHYKYAPKPRL